MDLLKPRHGIITITRTDESNPHAVAGAGHEGQGPY